MASAPLKSSAVEFRLMKFSELVRLLEAHGFSLVKQKDSVRYYGRDGWPRLVRVDFHGPKEVPTGTCSAILKAAGIPKP
jgi:predicted RNA binding protein YcfA (HicA-like mRNA interferase family)